MTTVTPSDQAGADSARRSATIPTQRSGRALRLLVLGTGPEAAAFKALAAETGAELAQRYSSRVTHVVVEDGIREEDARVVRARAADIPVLGLAEGAGLFDTAAETQDAELEAASGGRGEGAEAAWAETRVGAGAANAGAGLADTGAGVGVGDVGADEREGVRAGDVEPVEQGERVEIRPSDVFAGSALEAALLFPPLTVDEGLAAPVSALMEVASAACGCVDDEMPAAEGGGDLESEIDLEDADSLEALADGEREEGGDADGSEVGDGGGDADEYGDADGYGDGDEDGGEGEILVVDVGPSAASVSTGVAGFAGAVGAASVPRGSGRAGASIAWALVPLLSFGLLTPVALGYAAHRLRSRALAVATVLYSVAVVAAFTVSAAAPLRTGSHAAVGDLLTGCLAASWLGGTLHAFLIRRRVF